MEQPGVNFFESAHTMSFKTTTRVQTTFPDGGGGGDADQKQSKGSGISPLSKVEALDFPSQTVPPCIATPAMDTDGGSTAAASCGGGYFETMGGGAGDTGGDILDRGAGSSLTAGSGGSGYGSTGTSVVWSTAKEDHARVPSFTDLSLAEESTRAISSTGGLEPIAAAASAALIDPSPGPADASARVAPPVPLAEAKGCATTSYRRFLRALEGRRRHLEGPLPPALPLPLQSLRVCGARQEAGAGAAGVRVRCTRYVAIIGLPDLLARRGLFLFF